MILDQGRQARTRVCTRVHVLECSMLLEYTRPRVPVLILEYTRVAAIANTAIPWECCECTLWLMVLPRRPGRSFRSTSRHHQLHVLQNCNIHF